MKKKIESSLFAKVFLLTFIMLSGVSLFVFGLLAWLMPQTYSDRLGSLLDGRAQELAAKLGQVGFSESGAFFDQFVRDAQIHSVELYDENGNFVPLPTAKNFGRWEGGEASVAQTEDDFYKDVPILSGHYPVSFADKNGSYMLVVFGAAEQTAQLRQAFLRIFPLVFSAISAVAFAMAWLYSRIVTKPVLEISRISEKMSGLTFDWKVEKERTDELGVLGKSLNTLAHNLSGALSNLRDANKKLQADMEREREQERARANFFAAVSHELKTPVTIMKGQLEGMLLGIGAYKDREKYLAKSLETANTLERMVQEIVTVSRLEAAGDGLKKERLDCVLMIQDYLGEMEDFIAKKELRIDLELPPSLWIDGNRMLMEKVFSNLIGNALKYSPQGAGVWVTALEKNGNFVFSVENGGVWIPKESLPKLFEAFYRVEPSRSRRTGGSGLGLYLVQEILRQHKSECAVCNTEAGVKFSFVI